ncbi:hypothetical protein KKF38_05275 [Patescibacteria group bacterium]|nr:hypothetical protein [Patescibacteria group bacterium]
MNNKEPDFTKILLFDAEIDFVKTIRLELISLGILPEKIFPTNDEEDAIKVVRSGVGNILSDLRLNEGDFGEIDKLIKEYVDSFSENATVVFWVADVARARELMGEYPEQIRNSVPILPKVGTFDPEHPSDFFETNFPRLFSSCDYRLAKKA